MLTYCFSFLFFTTITIIYHTIGIPADGTMRWLADMLAFVTGFLMIGLMFAMGLHIIRSGKDTVDKTLWLICFCLGTFLTSFVYFVIVYRASPILGELDEGRRIED